MPNSNARHKIQVLFISLSIVLVFAGCGGDYTGSGDTAVPLTLSCTLASSNLCYDYSDGYTAAAARTACSTSGGVFSTTSNCTATTRIGVCSTVDNNIKTLINYYPTAYNSSTAASDCATHPTNSYVSS